MAGLYFQPASLTWGTSAESVAGTWAAISDWEFAITLDGTARDITSLDFSNVTDMDWVATVIQDRIRAITSWAEIVTWDTDHFIITSWNITTYSAITVTSTVGWGGWTDISEAWILPWASDTSSSGSTVVSTTWWRWQSFAWTDTIVLSVLLKVFAPTPSWNFVLDLFLVDWAWEPTGSTLWTITVANSSLPWSATEHTFTFWTPVAIASWNNYAFVCKSTWSNVALTVSTGSSWVYPVWNLLISSDSWGTWTVDLNDDLYFTVNIPWLWLDADTGNWTVTGNVLLATGYDQNRNNIRLAVDSTDSDRLEPIMINPANGGLLIEN